MRFTKTTLGATAVLTVALLGANAYAQLDSRWTVQVDGKIGYALPDGSFRVSNVSAADNFGSGGPGTPRDGVSDRLFRAEGVSTSGGTTRYFVSEAFRIHSEQTYPIERVSVSTTPPAIARSLRIEAPETHLDLGATGSLRVMATLNDGTETDVTGSQLGTTLVSSDRRVVSVTPDGRVSALRRGVVFVTANHFGVAATRRFEVVVEDVLVTLQGFVQMPDGSVADGVTVSTNFGGTAMTDANGYFSITIAVPAGTRVTVSAEVAGEFLSFIGEIEVTALEDGVIDAGVIVLEGGLANPLFHQPAIDGDDTPSGLAVGDFDGDSDLDVVTSIGSRFQLFRNEGDESFSRPEVLHQDPILRSVVADLDGNGSDDLVYDSARNVIVALSTGEGRFDARANLTIPAHAQSGSRRDLFVEDLDGDGNLDIAMTISDGSAQDGTFFLVFTGDGEASFALHDDVMNDIDPLTAAMGDVDGDLDLDLVIAWNQTQTFELYENDGDGHFAQSGHDPIPKPNQDRFRTVASLILEDLDGDGLDDLLLSDSRCCPVLSDLYVYFANPQGELGAFDAPAAYIESRPARNPAVGDIDGDGDLDVVVNSQIAQGSGGTAGWFTDNADITVLENDGDGALSIARRLGSTSQIADVVLADMDGERGLDVVVRHFSGRVIGIAFNDGNGAFITNPKVSVGSNPRSVALGDLDGDDIPDLIAGYSQGLAFRPGVGDGTFGPKEDPATGFSLNESIVTIADVDADGMADVVAGSNILTLLFGAAEGLEAPVNLALPVNSRISDIEVVDLDEDGAPEIVLAVDGIRELAVLPGAGNREFGDPFRFTFDNNTPSTVHAWDVEGDGDTDIVVGFRTVRSARIGVFRNTGDGTLAEPELLFEGFSVPTTYGGEAADMSGDGALDLVIMTDEGLLVVLGDGAGGFSIEHEWPGPHPNAILTTDLDGDGDIDVAAAVNEAVVATLLNEGDGTLVEEGRYLVGVLPRHMATADLDRDGDADIVATNSTGDTSTVSVLLNRRIVIGR